MVDRTAKTLIEQEERKRREAASLRANLLRRKAQARARVATLGTPTRDAPSDEPQNDQSGSGA